MSVLSSPMKMMQRAFFNRQASRPILAVCASFTTSTSRESSHRYHEFRPKQEPQPTINMNDSKIGFIGIGKIAQSIIQAIIKKQLIRPENIHASEINKEYMVYLKESSDVFQVFEFLFYV